MFHDIILFSTLEVKNKERSRLKQRLCSYLLACENVVWKTSYKIFFIFLFSSFG